MLKKGTSGGAYPGTGNSCVGETVYLGWVRMLDEAADKHRETLHQISEHRPCLGPASLGSPRMPPEEEWGEGR